MHLSGWTWKPLRLEDTVPGSPAARELRSAGYDLMVVGHEYPTRPAWRRIRDEPSSSSARPLGQSRVKCPLVTSQRLLVWCFTRIVRFLESFVFRAVGLAS